MKSQEIAKGFLIGLRGSVHVLQATGVELQVIIESMIAPIAAIKIVAGFQHKPGDMPTAGSDEFTDWMLHSLGGTTETTDEDGAIGIFVSAQAYGEQRQLAKAGPLKDLEVQPDA